MSLPEARACPYPEAPLIVCDKGRVDTGEFY